MTKYPCAAPGCFALVDNKGDYCAKHQGHKAEADRIKAAQTVSRWQAYHGKIEYADLWRTKRWREMRAAQLAKEPRCRMCGEPATTVDHIIPHKGRDAFFYSPDNLQSLCASCHAAKSRRDRAERNPIGGVEK